MNQYLEKIAASFRTPENLGKRMSQLMEAAGNRIKNKGAASITRKTSDIVTKNIEKMPLTKAKATKAHYEMKARARGVDVDSIADKTTLKK